MIGDIQPGRYHTRSGMLAVVTHTNDKMEAPFYWVGSVAGEIEVWDRIGRYYSNGRESPWDLVSRIQDEPPADNRIERAVTLLQGLKRFYTQEFGYALKEYEVAEAIRILEGRENEH